MTLGKAIEAYLREAVKAFEEAERRDYAEANAKRDAVAAARFVDLLFGRYQGKKTD